jgi:prephenate dehydrogenase
MERVAIIGLGLMGGSLGLALKASGFTGEICGYARRAETRALALKKNVCDRVVDNPRLAVEEADVSVFCVPVGVIPMLIESCADAFKPGCVITDVGSTKRDVCDAVSSCHIPDSIYFIGCHPVAGSEQAGLESARSNLYHGAMVVLTPDDHVPESASKCLGDMWQRIGARVLFMTPEEHDRVLVRTSHLPHISASILARTVAADGRAVDELGPLCGTGYYDSTRVAEGSPIIWRDIIEANRDLLIPEIAALEEEVRRFREVLEKGNSQDVEAYLAAAREARCQLMAAKMRCIEERNK